MTYVTPHLIQAHASLIHAPARAHGESGARMAARPTGGTMPLLPGMRGGVGVLGGNRTGGTLAGPGFLMDVAPGTDPVEAIENMRRGGQTVKQQMLREALSSPGVAGGHHDLGSGTWLYGSERGGGLVKTNSGAGVNSELTWTPNRFAGGGGGGGYRGGGGGSRRSSDSSSDSVDKAVEAQRRIGDIKNEQQKEMLDYEHGLMKDRAEQGSLLGMERLLFGETLKAPPLARPQEVRSPFGGELDAQAKEAFSYLEEALSNARRNAGDPSKRGSGADGEEPLLAFKSSLAALNQPPGDDLASVYEGGGSIFGEQEGGEQNDAMQYIGDPLGTTRMIDDYISSLR